MMAPHNTFLLYSFELGIFGLFCLVWLLRACIDLRRRGATDAHGVAKSFLIRTSVALTAATPSGLFVKLPMVFLILIDAARCRVRLAVDACQPSSDSGLTAIPPSLMNLVPCRATRAWAAEVVDAQLRAFSVS